jgi:hypothetical protein
VKRGELPWFGDQPPPASGHYHSGGRKFPADFAFLQGSGGASIDDQLQGKSMRWWLLGGVAALGLIALANQQLRESVAGEVKRPRWLTDYAAARKAARQSGKPILVVFR